MTERDKRRIRRDLGAEDVDRLSLCGDEEEEEWDVDIRGLKPLMCYTIACYRTSAGVKKPTAKASIKQLPKAINKKTETRKDKKKDHVP